MIVAGNLVKRGISLVQQLDQRRPTPLQLQQRTLLSLLKRAEKTAFGQHYGFEQILKAADPASVFQELVPMHDYNRMFDEWWRRTLAGEADVSWRGPVKYFALSSGTSEAASKYIPVTAEMQRSMRQAALRMFSCLPKYNFPPSFYTKEWLMIGGSAALQDLGHCYAGDLSGINASKPPMWIRRYYRPGTRIARISDWDERTEAIAKMAPHWDVGVLTGLPSWVQLTLERVIEYHGLNHIHEIWPNLRIFVSGGIAFEPYRKSFEELLGHPLTYMDSYLASEGFVAFQARPGTSAMRLQLSNNIFFEFVPFNEDNFDAEGRLLPSARAFTIDEVEEGQDYALLMSTCAGAWRYLIGDTVRFADKGRSEILITGRTKHFLSICGEHLSVDNMNQAIRRTEDVLNVKINEFTVSGVKAEAHFAHRWYIGCEPMVDSDTLSRVLDEQLMAVNDDYAAERSAMLRPPRASAIDTRLFYDWQRQHGKMNGQSKFPRVMKGEQLAEWEAFIGSKQ
ncbi:MAG: GH3 auxin-responsive promoter family protein [Phaeodactylibacter sp.]|nr:GH3 auxin-responsive promoter family protein [Phaeodactylibacter sp.]MCB9053080.1 GH3 auxin-responsive promoter family protein [Lewinellaceae bacterium]